MASLAQTVTNLRSLPDAALQQELTNPSGMIPSYLVLAEAQRRATLRTAAQRSQTQPSGTVYDDVIRNLMARQPAPGPPAPVGMAVPGPMRMADGGSVDDWEPMIQQVATNEGVPADVLREVMRAESSGDPNALSRKGAMGLMQLLPSTARDLGVNPRDPIDNLTGGARYLRQMHNRYGDWPTALAAYNAGEGNVDKYGGIPPFRETRGYVNTIMRHLQSGEAFPPRESTANPEKRWPSRSGSLPSGPADVLDPSTFTPDPNDPTRGTMQVDPQAAAATQQMLTTADASGLPAPPAPIDATGAPLTPAPVTDGSNPLAGLGSPPAAPAPPGTAVPPGTALPAAATPAPAPIAAMPTRAQQLAALGLPTVDDSDLRARIAKLQAQADQKHPKLSQMLMNLGAGMASSNSPFFGVNLGAGEAAMAKGINDWQDEQRKLQLQLLGVNMDLDKQAQANQQKGSEIQAKAVDQTQKANRAHYQQLLKLPGSVADVPNNPTLKSSGYTFTPDPDDATRGVWTIGMMPLTENMTKLAGVNPATNQPFQKGDMVPSSQWLKIDTATRQTATAGAKSAAKPTAAAQAKTDAIAQLFRNHPELAAPTNADGSVRSPTSDDVPAELQDELHYTQLLQKGMTEKLAEDINANPNAAQWQKDQATKFLGGVTTQAGARATAAQNVPQDPEEVKRWATLVHNDAKNWTLVQGNKGLAEAVRKELAASGMDVTQLDAQTRQTAEFAHTVRPHINNISSLIDKLDQQGKLGPLMGRWNEFRQGKWGAADPDYVTLRNNINLLDSAVARIHGGARGGGSPPMIAYMHNMLGAEKMDAPTLRAAVNVFNDWVKGYEGMAPQFAGPGGGGGGNQKQQYQPGETRFINGRAYKRDASGNWQPQ